MQHHIQGQDVPMTCRLDFFIHIFFLEQELESEGPSRLFALCCLLGPPSLNRFLRLFPSICSCSLPEFFFVTKGVPRWIFNPSSRKSYYIHRDSFSSHFLWPIPPGYPDPSATILCLFYLWFFLYYTVVGEDLIFESMFLQISFTYTRNSSVPKLFRVRL